MKKTIRIIIAVSAAVLAAAALCSCNEYKEAQDDFASNVTSLMIEANDLRSEIDQHTSEFQEAASGLNSTVDGIKEGIKDGINNITGQNSESTQSSEG